MSKLRVMISSTVDDLSDERQSADDAVQHFQFERFRSETLGSLSRVPEEVCDEMARECDLFILIIGERYGWVIPELGISVTEREYVVARNCDREKVLVYVKSVTNGDREARETEFMERVTDFRTGYFRSGEFNSPSQLADKIRHDIPIWISDRLRQQKVSYADAINLAHPRELISSLLYGFTLVVGLFLAPSLFRIGGNRWQPSISSIGETLRAESNHIIVGLFGAWWNVVVAAMIAVVLSALVVLVVLLASRKNRGLLLRIASHVSFAVAAFSFLLGQFSFGFSRLPLFVVLTLTSTGWLLLIVRKEVARSRTQSGALNASVDMLVVVRNVVLARDLPLILPVLFGLFFVHQLSFGFGPGLVRLYQEGFGAAKPEMLYGIVLVSGTTAFIVYILVRLVQSHIGWTTIIDPALRRSIARPKD